VRDLPSHSVSPQHHAKKLRAFIYLFQADRHLAESDGRLKNATKEGVAPHLFSCH
jgi:hypothetical protein